MPLRACIHVLGDGSQCGELSKRSRCPRHRARGGRYSAGRNSTEQARFRAVVLERAGYRCEDCGSRTDLRACHIRSLAQGGSNNPVTNGRCRCGDCDRATDRYAR